MAYVAVASLLNTLELLLRYPCMILQIKQLQVQEFSKHARHTVQFFNDSSAECRDSVMRTIDKAASMAYTIEDFVKYQPVHFYHVLKIQQGIWDTCDRSTDMVLQGRIEMLKEVPSMLEEMNVIKTELIKFSSEMYDPGILEAESRLLGLSRLLCAQDNLKNGITYWNKVSVHIIILCQDLKSLLACLKDSANNCNDPDVINFWEGCIRNVANKASDYLEEAMMDNSLESELKFWKENLSLLNVILGTNLEENTSVSDLNEPPLECSLKVHQKEKHAFEQVLQNLLEQEKGIYQYLLQTIEEINSIKRSVKMIHDKAHIIGDLQVGNSLLEGSSRDHSNRKDIVVGLDNDLMRIIDELTRLPSGLQTVTIVGMGGIGKTTLARNVFDHPFIVYHFYCRAWITVSQGYQVRDLWLGLLHSVTQVNDETRKKTTEQLAEALYRSLKGRRYLIVLDDVWSVESWNAVKRSFPDDKNGSRIMLTSRLMNVAICANPKSPPHCMSLLSNEESWELLQKRVFGKENCPLELVEFGKQIAKQCQGLPLAIVVVAGFLSRIWTYEGWKYTADRASSLVTFDPDHCLNILALSYNHLPHHLKACFLYMGAFPEDCEITVQRLIDLWMAEGFLDLVPSGNLEQVAEDYLEDLVSRSLVLVGKRSFSGKTKTCCLHDLLRKLCLREAQKDNFMHVMERHNHDFPLDIKHHRRMSVHSDLYHDVHLLPSIPLARTFLCFSVGLGIVPDIFFFWLGFKLLRVLDIVFLRFDSFPIQILELSYLRYLALTATFALSSSISKLSNLQTLYIHGPWIYPEHSIRPTVQFPYCEMPKLRHLCITVACYFRKPLIGPDYCYSWDLKSLRRLSAITFASCTKEVLESMLHLQKLELCEAEDDFMVQSFKLLDNLVCLAELESLKCSFLKNRWEKQLPCLGAFHLISLKKLTLISSHLPWTEMVSIAQLPKLEVLKLKDFAFWGPIWDTVDAGFCCLKQLLIEKTDLVYWKATRSNFPILEHLVLRSCDFLVEIPFGVGEIPTLKLVELHSCKRSAENSVRNIQEMIEDLDVVIQSDRCSLENRKRLNTRKTEESGKWMQL